MTDSDTEVKLALIRLGGAFNRHMHYLPEDAAQDMAREFVGVVRAMRVPTDTPECPNDAEGGNVISLVDLAHRGRK